MASVGAVSTIQAAQRPLSSGRPQPVAAPQARARTAGPAVVDDISAAGRRAAAARVQTLRQLERYATGPVTPKIDLTAPQNLDQTHKNLTTSREVVPSRLTGMMIEKRAEAMRASDGVNRRVQSGQNPLGPGWNAGPPESQRANRPGKDILDAAKKMRESGSGLSASIARGQGMLKAGSIKDLNTEGIRRMLRGPGARQQ